MPEPYQLAPFSVKELLVYLLWHDQTSQSVVKVEPSYPAEEAHFHCLYLPSHYYLVTMQSLTGRRVICQLRFYNKLSLPHTRVAQRWYRYDTSLSLLFTLRYLNSFSAEKGGCADSGSETGSLNFM